MRCALAPWIVGVPDVRLVLPPISDQRVDLLEGVLPRKDRPEVFGAIRADEYPANLALDDLETAGEHRAVARGDDEQIVEREPRVHRDVSGGGGKNCRESPLKRVL